MTADTSITMTTGTSINMTTETLTATEEATTSDLVTATYNSTFEFLHFHIVSGFTMTFIDGAPMSVWNVQLSGELFTGEIITVQKVNIKFPNNRLF